MRNRKSIYQRHLDKLHFPSEQGDAMLSVAALLEVASDVTALLSDTTLAVWERDQLASAVDEAFHVLNKAIHS